MKKIKIPKINSINFGGKWVGISVLTGVIVPGIIWFLTGKFLWELSVLGSIILLVFIIVFCIEMHQDFGKTKYYEKHLSEEIPYNCDTQYAVIKSSICTGEQLAGFKNRKTGQFTEVMLIKDASDLRKFKEMYGIEEIKKEY